MGDILLTLLLCCNQVHLFDIDIPGKITFKESDTLTPGEELCVVDTGNTISLSMKFTFVNHVVLSNFCCNRICQHSLPCLMLRHIRQHSLICVCKGSQSEFSVLCPDVGRIAVGICYDIRFPEMAMLYAARGN